MTLSGSDLMELLAKYAEMLRLRGADAPGADPMKAAMARLATEFPGALRELDDFSLDVLEARHAAVARACASPNAVQPWMLACSAFHHFARGALSAKRWLGGKKDVDEATATAFAAAAAALPFPGDALSWKDDLGALAAPPRGRISDVIFERTGRAIGVSPADVRVLVFGPSRRERRA